MSIDLGDAYRIAFRNLSPAGDLVSATNMALTITLPDGTTTVVDPVTPVSTGVYQHDYTTLQAGPHRARWVGTPYGAHVETIDVRPVRTDIISVAAAKRQIGVDALSTVHDDELAEFVEALTAVIEGPDGLGRAVVKRTVVEPRTVDCATRRLALNTVPVISLTSVVDLNGSSTWNVADFHVDGDTGVVTVLDGGLALSGLVQLTYTAGFLVIPAEVSLAAKMCLQEWWRTQRADRGGPRFVGGQGQDDATLRAGWGVSLLVPEARQLLGPALSGIG